MKDPQGKWRGKCENEDCICVEYIKPKELEQYKCDYCNHVPVQHKLIIENQSIEIKENNKNNLTAQNNLSSINNNNINLSSTDHNNLPQNISQNNNKTNLTSPNNLSSINNNDDNKNSVQQPIIIKESRIVETAVSSREIKKKSILDNLKNPKKLIKDKMKKKKA